jgi:Fe-S cluster assembly ATPase SufC
MTKNELAQLLKYSSPREIYVITHYNVLIRLFCPFRVKVLQDIGTLKSGQTVLVDEIKVTLELKTVYIIDNDAYYYYHFNILM